MASASKAGMSPGPSPHPVDLPQLGNLDLRTRYHSARWGGDFFDAVALGSRVVLLLTDIAGRRPETHAIAAEVQKVFRRRAQDLFGDSGANESEGIALLARDINRSLIEAAGGVRFAPAFLGCYNLALHILTYHYAGHLLALFHDAGKTHALEPCGIPLGLFTHSTYEPAVLAFDMGARLLLLTKGNAEGRRAKIMSDDGRVRLLLENSADAASLCEAVLQTASEPVRHRRSRVRDLVRSRSRKDCDDLTAVVLVRRD